MRSEAAWQQQAETYVFSGCWNHVSVSQYWSELCHRKAAVVDVAEVDRLDSAFLTLLMQLSAKEQPLVIQGASASMRSLLDLYNLYSVFCIDGEGKR